ncbi:uncharacterized protein LOC135808575 [Sycon ciliatum]|uniref:uncharacterized protein LOC135808575 n=1 Tax=Sycon ciliatum TaxID=27933 RepID=UPI0031F62000
MRLSCHALWTVCCGLTVCVMSTRSEGTAPDFSAWSEVVSTHIKPGESAGVPLNVVNYTGIAADPNFQATLDLVAKASVGNLTRNETYATFINIYNLFAISMVIHHPCSKSIFGGSCSPIKSIKDIGSLLSPVWKKTAGSVGGKSYSLDDVEDFLRNPAPFKEDPRLHACIVCASISCPDVRTEAFQVDKLDQQMTDQMTKFLSNPKKGMSLNMSTKTVTLSPIFQWFAADFVSAAGSVKNFILPFIADADVASFVRGNDVTLAYFDYDWNLNGAAPCQC